MFLLLALASSASASFTVQSVDSGNAVYISLVLDGSDYPWLVYFASGSDLNLARWTGSQWAFEGASCGNLCARFPDAALDSSGNLHVSHGYNAAQLVYSYRTSGGSWTNLAIDTNAQTGDYSGIALDGSNLPGIAYLQNSNKDLKYAKCTASPCTTKSNWHVEFVDRNVTTAVTWKGNNILFDASGNPHFIYRSGSVTKHAYKTGGIWNFNNIGGFTNSIGAVGSGNNIHVCHNASNKLYYAYYNGSTWTDVSLSSVDNNNTYDGCSIALDASGYPHISYKTHQTIGYVNFSIRHAYCTSSPCTSAVNWTTENVKFNGTDPSNNQFSEIKIGSNDLVQIAYVSGSNEHAEEDAEPLLPEIPFHTFPLLTAIVLLSVYLIRGRRD